jgi:RHS repeat-associated protein
MILGSPRIITNAIGQAVSRHDYLAFGDEVTDTVGNVGGRNSTHGYGVDDELRQDYTGYQKDDESGLEFAQARYYNGKHGRFTSVDPMTGSANVKDPQTFNRYSYSMNSPYKFTDPLGLIAQSSGGGGGFCAAESNSCNEAEGSSSFSDMFESMALNNAVDMALQNLETYIGDNIGQGDAYSIQNALKHMLKKGNAVAQNIASAIINSNIRIDTQTGTASTSYTDISSADLPDLNKAIKDGCMNVAGALGYLTIHILPSEISNSVSSVAAIESTLVHEGFHALSYAVVIADISAGGNMDKSRITDEYDAKYAAAKFEVDRGGVYVKHGQASMASSGGLIDKSGKVNVALIQNVANTEIGTIRSTLKAMGVKW